MMLDNLVAFFIGIVVVIILSICFAIINRVNAGFNKLKQNEVFENKKTIKVLEINEVSDLIAEILSNIEPETFWEVSTEQINDSVIFRVCRINLEEKEPSIH